MCSGSAIGWPPRTGFKDDYVQCRTACTACKEIEKPSAKPCSSNILGNLILVYVDHSESAAGSVADSAGLS